MPYISQEERKKYDEVLKKLINLLKEIPIEKVDGHINYLVTKILKSLYKPKYFNYNRAIGLLECIKQEFYRRQVASYENEKIKEHGDVE